ncbi:NAD(P)/FAD-dependent oxidoreductase [Amantichitinum ursilacus]|uniref:L-2-hydroxyglutarate oxidase LhgO n=1 Tax=Amantichitinum ursilacus TaxID=857265 RepID=A0A0N0XID0_9NEIS|nr:NAD(P)/FAD-dependent oxidoreductase [Amantichitinum ursilacus]KPC52721.1 L-2-hydroxyglutarate oxidase LhgO [Amantichitinum ursilacus]
MQTVDIVVVGAGVVGLAVARALARAGRQVLVLEAAPQAGMGTSARGSKVIHAGLYYPAGSLKAQLCTHGRQLLYAYCQQRQIAYRRCGKLLVATSDNELDQLHALQLKAKRNGVTNLQLISAARAQALEPELRCSGALLSPDTGIVDSAAYVRALQTDAERAGARFVFNAELASAETRADGFMLIVRDAMGTQWRARQLINCAGLWAPRLAAQISGLPQQAVPQAYYAKGHYFRCDAPSRFSHLIYPLPNQAGLGVHLTLDLAGRVRFGPDVQWLDGPGIAADPAHIAPYPADPQRAAAFYTEIRKYWPGLPDGALRPDSAGIRPKLAGADAAAQDFRIDTEAQHGVRGLINLFGIESPGLTASLALGEHVAALVQSGAEVAAATA